MRETRRLVVVVLLVGVATAACAATPTPTAPARQTAAASTPAPPPPSPTPGASTAVPTSTPAPSITPAATPAPTRRPTQAPSPTAVPTPAGPTSDGFWAAVERAIVTAGTLEIQITGVTAGTLRYEADASATAIEGVVGFVCVDGRAYDGQSGFTTLPGTWTCGPPALTAGFKGIGQPADAWSRDIPTDRARRQSVVENGSTWTWRYQATSPYLGGAVAASVTIDRATGRITAARRTDPTGVTRYAFRYGAKFPPIVVPR